MRYIHRTTLLFALIGVLSGLAWLSSPVFAQEDPSGEWANLRFEDAGDRTGGPEIGNYLGIPLNNAARLRADTWEAGLQESPFVQCRPHTPEYEWRASTPVRIWGEFDRESQKLIAYHLHSGFYGSEQTIWMDGRPRPPSYAPHTWMGFSTGHWEGDILAVLTDHLKENGYDQTMIPISSLATQSTHIMRHGDYLTVAVIIYDPVYLTEPYMRSEDFEFAPQQQIAPWPCESVEEVNRPAGVVPNHLPGTNKFLSEFPAKYGIPPEAARGGQETMYPEYIQKMKTMKLLPRPPAQDAGQ